MESKRKQRAGFKEKPSFYRARPPSSVQYSSKVQPARSSATSLGLLVEDGFVISSPNQKEGGGELGGYIAVDFISEESVDNRAASYISCVQERFRLERVDEDWRARY